ncbi:TetR/AcrR family transcriptional regulator [Chryseolinea sp. H1M3-3]|uniref:TetR/AcrR family transcriptional regulator n=1 Tax=Chryseolinea sp. H1M3-3 TaxID=3034144 RepID=UPI0023EDFE67|nr:TetR/AcrR family transcriptional regulator [Chryseolinea sp. H1M3-3]
MSKKKIAEPDLSTEEKIKDAAQRVFMQKGYAATRTRDIAEEAGINLALLNYYFRSKEKLFELIMLEKLEKFFGSVAPVLNNAETTLDQKVILFSNNYIDLLIENPELPLFILSEIRYNPDRFAHKLPVAKIADSLFLKQLHEKRQDINPVHFLMNILAMSVFPFIMKPVFHSAGIMNDKTFTARMMERKALIPKWINAMLKAK